MSKAQVMHDDEKSNEHSHGPYVMWGTNDLTATLHFNNRQDTVIEISKCCLNHNMTA
jgi:hypothetical protein